MKSKEFLKSHIQIVHIGARPFKCPQCTQGFKISAQLTKHIKFVHTADQILVKSECPVCGKMVKHLNHHMTIHSGEKPHKCSFCEKIFRMHWVLKNHERTHTGEKPYYCQFCSATFSNRSTLVKHESVVHLEKKPAGSDVKEKPFKCELCSKTFGRIEHMKRHVSDVHHQERSFKCDTCLKSFKRKEVLKRHIQTQSTSCAQRKEASDQNAQPLKCSYCEKVMNTINRPTTFFRCIRRLYISASFDNSLKCVWKEGKLTPTRSSSAH